MFLKKLKLTNFRNYADFEQEFNTLKTIIIGPNAQGKTNILEAINILATSVSDRAERDSNLVSWNNEYALIFADIQTKDDNLNIALQINSSGRRKLKINGVAKRAPQADLLGNFFCVMFSCEDLYLIKGSPSVRRSWLDSILFQLDIKYHKALQDYQKSVTQKNALLKNSYESGMSRKALKEQLDIWNEQIINFGSEILIKRLGFIEEIKVVAREFQKNISKGNEELDLIYQSTVTGITSNIDQMKISFKKSLEESFEKEIARGQSVIGPHRDDLTFLINEKEAKSFASQGQQRSIVLALKLSELKVIEHRKGEIPVLLLDDVFAELDESRQDFLLHNLPPNIQTFITTTHISDIQKELLENAKVIKIESGKVLNLVG
jgi:DNA replication and repair protein RecF